MKRTLRHAGRHVNVGGPYTSAMQRLRNPDDRAPGRARVPAVGRAARILEVISAADRPMGLAEITRVVAAPKSSVMGICHALAEENLLSRGADGSYAPGARLFELAAAARSLAPPVGRVGYCYPSEEQFFVAGREALLEAAAALGAAVEIRCADQSVEQQARDLVELAGSGVDLLLVDPVASDALQDAIAVAREARIPIVAVGSTVAGTAATVTTDNTKAGALVGRLLARRLNGRGRVVIVDGIAITANADRIAGFLGVLRQYPQLQVVGHFYGDLNAESGQRAAQEVIESGIEVDGFFAVNDQIALGLASALGSGSPPAPIVSVDGVAAAVEQIRVGGPIIGTAAQDPAELMRLGFRTGLALLADSGRLERTAFLTPVLVDADSVQDYQPWG